ncbi:MAG: DUF2628 domain-containing protein [Pseudorhodoplanes sp.]
MAVYTVHQPPLRRGETASDPGRFVFVRDGFHFWAFVFGPFWMLRHRLWLALVLYLALIAAVFAAIWFAGAGRAAPFVQLLLALLIGIEASTLRRWTLKRRGWQERGVVVGDDLESAERRFFDGWTARGAAAGSNPAAPPRPLSDPPRDPANARGQTDIIGLFPEPGSAR